MTDTRKRSVHPTDFKAKVGLEAVRGVKTINEIAQDYGVHPVQVSQWKREIQDQAKTLFEGKRGSRTIGISKFSVTSWSRTFEYFSSSPKFGLELSPA